MQLSGVSLLKKFEKVLQEGDTIFLNRCGVASNNGKFPIIKHQYKINFYGNTTVTKCDDFDGPIYGFCFVSFDDILNGCIDQNTTVDVIATVINGSNLHIFERAGQETKRMTLDLEDLEGKRLGCTLWDSYAQQFANFVEDGNNEVNVVIILQFAKIRVWKGNPVVNNIMFGTRLFVNDTGIDELVDFKSRLQSTDGGQSSSHIGTHLSSQTVYSDREVFLQNHPRKFVDELIEIKQETVCIVFGKIKSIQEQYGWFYPGCPKCCKKVVPKWEIVDLEDIDVHDDAVEDDGVLYCPRCKTKATSIVPMYKVNVRVQDDTGTVSFVLFDAELMKLVKSTASQVHEKQIKNGDGECFPEELKCIINRKFVFLISVSPYNIQNKWYVYTVLKTSDDTKLISAMENNKATIKVNDGFDSVRLDDSSQGCLDSKDALSYTADYSTLVDLDNSATSPLTKRAKSSLPKDDLLRASSTKKALLPVKLEKA